MVGRDDPDDELLALHALDALEGDEKAWVEAAVAASPALAERLEYHRDTAAMLGRSVAAEPPPDLKQRVLDAAFAASPPRSQETTEAPSVVVSLEQRRTMRTSGVLAALAVAAALVLGLVLVGRGADDQPETARAVLVGDAGSLAVVADDGRILLSGDDLDPLPTDRTYQLWLVAPDQTVRSAGLFAPAADGSVEAELSADVGDATAKAVSLEPAGGSPDPNAPSGPVSFSAELTR